MEARQRRDSAEGLMPRTTARPAISQVAGDVQVSAWNEQQSHDDPKIRRQD